VLVNREERLRAELQRLDLLLCRQILRLRATYELSLDEFRGLYVSDEQVDVLINNAAAAGTSPSISDLTAKAAALRRTLAASDADSPFACLTAEFELSDFERDVLLLALAPEADLKYETLYAYLNNDVTRKYPTVDLALRVFSDDSAERQRHRRHLLPDASLFRHGLLQHLTDAADHPHLLANGFSLSPSATHFLLGLPHTNARLAHLSTQHSPAVRWQELPLAEQMRERLAQILNFFAPGAMRGVTPVFIFEGRYGAGREASAAAVCGELGLDLIRFRLDAGHTPPEQTAKLLTELALQQRLKPAGAYLEPCEALFDREGNLLPESAVVAHQLAALRPPVFLACEPGARWHELLQGRRSLAFRFDEPDFDERRRLWVWYAAREGAAVEDAAAEALATHFVLTPGQIRDAVAAVVDARSLRGERPVTLHAAELFEAARAQSHQNIGQLAVKINTPFTWDDLVLPRATLRQVREVTAAIRFRHVVYTEWGFARRVAAGKGLKVLFSGASGTGKTMTAGVIAGGLGLDLYKIDLSCVVSKYIGETEKNLDRIFGSAQASNAILFFDEADALFGKRSEVKDAHDRYANIEVAYLLQKMEEHEGAVILASNLSKNIDNAFSRRMHYVVEFPLPDEHYRERLWRGMFPAEAPVGADVDFPYLAKQFPLAGGDIRNVALGAAFLAARDGQAITMRQLVRALARQMMKQGRSPSPIDFKQYYSLIGQGE